MTHLESLLEALAGNYLVQVRVWRGKRKCCGRGYVAFEQETIVTGVVRAVTEDEAMIVVAGIGGPTAWVAFQLADILQLTVPHGRGPIRR